MERASPINRDESFTLDLGVKRSDKQCFVYFQLYGGMRAGPVSVSRDPACCLLG